MTDSATVANWLSARKVAFLSSLGTLRFHLFDRGYAVIRASPRLEVARVLLARPYVGSEKAGFGRQQMVFVDGGPGILSCADDSYPTRSGFRPTIYDRRGGRVSFICFGRNWQARCRYADAW